MRRLFKRLINILLRRSRPESYGIQLGPGAVVYPPRSITGGRHITIGSRSSISANACLSAYDSCADVTYSPEILIGEDVYIGAFSTITCISKIQIGHGCVFSEFVYISDHGHGLNPEAGLITNQPLESKGPVVIGDHSFVGYQSCIFPGVSLGKHCVVGANSVVTHSFPGYSMIAGSPARLIKTYDLAAHAWVPVKPSG